MTDTEAPDAIDAAIESTEPTQWIAQFEIVGKGRVYMAVPLDFDSDGFESCVATLVQLRMMADQKKAAENPPAILPIERPPLVGPDGQKLS